MRKFDSVQHSVYYFCNKPKKKIKCESISFMSGLPIAVVFLTGVVNIGIYAQGFSLSGHDIYITDHFLVLILIFWSNSLQPSQVEYVDFLLLLPGLD